MYKKNTVHIGRNKEIVFVFCFLASIQSADGATKRTLKFRSINIKQVRIGDFFEQKSTFVEEIVRRQTQNLCSTFLQSMKRHYEIPTLNFFSLSVVFIVIVAQNMLLNIASSACLSNKMDQIQY